jgi:glyoxylase-like metal-dependent hydrolase (beta-lactamase superfamily II)
MKGVAALATALLALGAIGSAHADTPAQAEIARAAQALGGAEKILALHSLSYEGLGWNANLMQQMRPEAPLLLWMLPTYSRTIDLENQRSVTALIRRPAFPAVFDNRASETRLDGDVAWDVATDATGKPRPQRVAADQVPIRRRALLHHPITAVRAALAPGAKVSRVSADKDSEAFEVIASDGDRFTLTLDRNTALPVSVSTLEDHVQLGDVLLTTRFSGYEYLQPAGVRLPKRLLSTIDRWPDYDIGVMRNSVDVEVASLRAPGAVRAAAAPEQVDDIAAEELAPGIWHLTGGFRLSSVVIAFADHLAILEVPNNETRARALFAKARSLGAGKPLTTAIFTHFHADHAGGFRATVAEGLTVYAQRGNEALFREFARRPKTLVPDALARQPKALKFVPVDDRLVLKDSSQELDLIHAVGSTHADTMLMAYFPASNLLVQADLWTPGSAIVPHAVQFSEELTRRGIDVARQVAIDSGQVRSQADFMEVVERLRKGAAR